MQQNAYVSGRIFEFVFVAWQSGVLLPRFPMFAQERVLAIPSLFSVNFDCLRHISRGSIGVQPNFPVVRPLFVLLP